MGWVGRLIKVTLWPDERAHSSHSPLCCRFLKEIELASGLTNSCIHYNGICFTFSLTCVASLHSATRVLKCPVAALLSSTQQLLMTNLAPSGNFMSVARTGLNSINFACTTIKSFTQNDKHNDSCSSLFYVLKPAIPVWPVGFVL